jgi:hypothetical protein
MGVLMKGKRPFWKMVRIPLPRKKSVPLSTRKGEKGYDRKRAKGEVKREIDEKC